MGPPPRPDAQPRPGQEPRHLYGEAAVNVLTNVEGIVTTDKLADTVDAIATIQLPDGNIPWVPGHHTDPWNLGEAAKALDVGGRHAAAERQDAGLRSRQRRD